MGWGDRREITGTNPTVAVEAGSSLMDEKVFLNKNISGLILIG